MGYFELKLHRHILGTPDTYITYCQKGHNMSPLSCCKHNILSSQFRLEYYSAQYTIWDVMWIFIILLWCMTNVFYETIFLKSTWPQLKKHLFILEMSRSGILCPQCNLSHWVSVDTKSWSDTCIFLVFDAQFKYIKVIKINPMYIIQSCAER